MENARIIKHVQSDNFTILPNALMADPRLSWKAKGILCYLLSKPADWEANKKDITCHGTDGEAAVASGLMELRSTGYAKLVQHREGGKIIRWEYHVADAAQFEESSDVVVVDDQGSSQSQEPESKTLEVGNLVLGNNPPTNKEVTKTEKANKERGGVGDCPLLPESLCTDRFLGVWAEWVEERRTRKQKLTRRAMELQLRKCAEWGEDKACEAIHQSIQNGWTGLFEPRAAGQSVAREHQKREYNGQF